MHCRHKAVSHETNVEKYEELTLHHLSVSPLCLEKLLQIVKIVQMS